MEKQQITKVPDAVERWLDFMFDALFNNTEKEVDDMGIKCPNCDADMEDTDSGYECPDCGYSETR